MRMIVVGVPTSFIVRCISYFMGFVGVYRVKVKYYPSWLLEQCNNEQLPGETIKIALII